MYNKKINIFILSLLLTNIITYNINADQKNQNKNQPIKNIKNSESKMIIQNIKIGFVNIQQIVSLDKNNLDKGSLEWKDLYNDLQKTIEPVKNELKELEEKYNKGRTEFENLHKSGICTKEALQKKYEEVGKLEYELRSRSQELENFAQSEIAKAQMIIGPKIDKTIAEIKTENGLDIILRGEIVLAASIEFDLTQQVINKLNKTYEKELKDIEEKKKAENNKKNEIKK
jgi:Skp family chaperone for outer membrane proteins